MRNALFYQRGYVVMCLSFLSSHEMEKKTARPKVEIQFSGIEFLLVSLLVVSILLYRFHEIIQRTQMILLKE